MLRPTDVAGQVRLLLVACCVGIAATLSFLAIGLFIGDTALITLGVLGLLFTVNPLRIVLKARRRLAESGGGGDGA